MKQESIDRGTLVDAVYGRINDDIRKRYFSPGQKLVIRELSERYGISQTPIKQALNRLVADRVVENIPRYGVYVRRITLEEIDEAMQARLMVEEYCVPFVIKAAKNPLFIEKAESIIQGHAALRGNADYDEIFTKHIQFDMQFHKLFINCCGNSNIIGYFNELTSPIYLNYVYFGKTMKRLWASFDEHLAVFEAVRAGQAAAVRKAIASHNRKTREDYLIILTKEENGAGVKAP